MSPQRTVLRIYVRDELQQWRAKHAHVLGPYNVTESALVEYWIYLVEAVMDAGWLVPNPEKEFSELAEHIEKDFCDGLDNVPTAREFFELMTEAKEITNIVMEYVVAIYHCSVPFLKDLITQPNKNFRLQVLHHDQVSILVEVLPNVDYVSQIPKPFVL